METDMHDLLDRLADKMLIGDGCWEWTGAHIPGGYGSISMPWQSNVGAHRVVYELLVGPIAQGMHLHHTCKNRGCVRPDHLEQVTPADHSRDHDFAGAFSREIRPTLTTCPKGHPYPDDPMRHPNGSRKCQVCSLERQARWRASPAGRQWIVKRRESRAAARQV